jgi:hypothetical protein
MQLRDELQSSLTQFAWQREGCCVAHVVSDLGQVRPWAVWACRFGQLSE